MTLTKINNCDQLKNAAQHKDCVAWYENTFQCKLNPFHYHAWCYWSLSSCWLSVFGSCISRRSSPKTTEDVAVMELNLNVGEMVIALIPSFLYAIVIAAVVSFFFILTLKWSAAFVFWGFVGLVMLCLVGLMIGVVVIGVTANFEGKDDAMVCFWLTTGTNHFLELWISYSLLFTSKLGFSV